MVILLWWLQYSDTRALHMPRLEKGTYLQPPSKAGSIAAPWTAGKWGRKDWLAPGCAGASAAELSSGLTGPQIRPNHQCWLKHHCFDSFCSVLALFMVISMGAVQRWVRHGPLYSSCDEMEQIHQGHSSWFTQRGGSAADQVSLLTKGAMLDQLFPPFAGGKWDPRHGFMASF